MVFAPVTLLHTAARIQFGAHVLPAVLNDASHSWQRA